MIRSVRGDARALAIVAMVPIIAALIIVFYVYLGLSMGSVEREVVASEFSSVAARELLVDYLEGYVDGLPRWKWVTFVAPDAVGQDLSRFLERKGSGDLRVREVSCRDIAGVRECRVFVKFRYVVAEEYFWWLPNVIAYRATASLLREKFAEEEFVLPALQGDVPVMRVFRVVGKREPLVQGEAL